MNTLHITRVSETEWHADFRGRIAVCTLSSWKRALVEVKPPVSASWSFDITNADIVSKVRNMAVGEKINL